MLIRLFRLAIAALALLIGGLVTANTNIPITNPDFNWDAAYHGIPGWTLTPMISTQPHYQSALYSKSSNNFSHWDSYYLPPGTSGYVQMQCYDCVAGPSNFNSLSQQVNGLVYGKKYQLNFYAYGNSA
jgi:hypothetical protein